MTPSLVLLAAAAASGAFADLDAIDRQVAAFTGAPVGEAGGALTPVDRRLRLQPCRSGIALSWRTRQEQSVVVQCGDINGWRLFVPVRRAAPVAAAAAPVPVANAVNRGDAVAIAITGDGFTVSQPGEAMEAGPVGAWIRVRPAGSANSRAEPMRARIERPGLVTLPLP
ncbi:flagella basal body P-ring formation protein FlgA [Novosphingobium mangrovi (ex Huang et al. 2023)]|uniref:Flagella basal body P-ring formation protein FlgA n=1 Tax=Novosphingobium mangrovi (ex Huang et al. 2023) TaxID=2976432 RepID=A0ABT2I027_9SPHN|nr:flagella basal body P-ring formation protein FlgA [Novosphingobium mangrovi (ex Huang et al. 2023)]MCT2398148.1 flagella basal body P-ring formation protein FlgA [Novosphingobium mangrovi (ex Huang et al. 2023)]